MKKFDCYEYCELDPNRALNKKILFGYSKPEDDYFNDNLDQYFDKDDYYDYSELEKFELEDKEYTFSHPPVH